MSGIKKGDRVHVEFDAYVYDDPDSVTIPVRYSVDICGYRSEVSPGVCTVIVPPVKVGDTVTDDNIGQLGVGSVIAYSGCSPFWREHDGRWHAGRTVAIRDSELNTPGYVVLRVGGGES